MALKFLNKKGWHTGSLRNIENVWKAEQKHDAEQKKLDELKKQIQEERERSEFRLLQEQAGLVPRQERLDFLYDSGLAVGKSSFDGFKALEAPPKAEAESSTTKQSLVPGALFVDKPQSANDSWRKLHSDPLLLIKQREQEALRQIKNNPVQMAVIRKSAEAKKKHKEEKGTRKEHKKLMQGKHSHRESSDSDSEEPRSEADDRRKRHPQDGGHLKKLKRDKHSSEGQSDSEGSMRKGEQDRRMRSYHQEDNHLKEEKGRRKEHLKEHYKKSKPEKHSYRESSDSEEHRSEADDRRKRHSQEGGHLIRLKRDKHSSEGKSDSEGSMRKGERDRRMRSYHQEDDHLKEEKGRRKEHSKEHYKKSKQGKHSNKERSDSEEPISEATDRRKRYPQEAGNHLKKLKRVNHSSEGQSDSEGPIGKGQEERGIRGHLQEGDRLKKASHKLHISDSRTDSEGPTGRADDDLRKRGDYHEGDHPRSQALENHHVRPNDLEHRSGSGHRHRPPVQKLSAEEKAARAREMQLDAEVHEEQRWKRLKKASEEDALEAARNAGSSTGRNFLDAAQKSVYGTEKGGSSTIEESVRRRTYYSQGRAGGAHEGNAFRR